jgi:uncharacterized protein (UPF0297 family)
MKGMEREQIKEILENEYDFFYEKGKESIAKIVAGYIIHKNLYSHILQGRTIKEICEKSIVLEMDISAHLRQTCFYAMFEKIEVEKWKSLYEPESIRESKSMMKILKKILEKEYDENMIQAEAIKRHVQKDSHVSRILESIQDRILHEIKQEQCLPLFQDAIQEPSLKKQWEQKRIRQLVQKNRL